MFSNSYISMDITNTDVRVLAVKNNKITKLSLKILPEGIVKGGIIREPQALGVILDNIFKTQGLKRNRVICTVTGLPFIYRTLNMPDKEKIPVEAIERESRREMSLAEEDMYLSWQTTETHPDTQEVDYFVLGMPRISLDPLVEALSKAGIKPYLVDAKPLALARAVSLKDSFIVSLEKGYYDVIVVANGLVRVIHSVNPSSKSGDTLELVNEIVDALRKAIKSFERDFPQINLPAETPVLLSGELSADSSLIQMVREATGYPVSILPSFLSTPAGMPIGLFGANLGLIAKKISRNKPLSEYHDINLNLLMGIKKQRVPVLQRAYVVSAVTCLVLAALVYKSYDLKTSSDAEAASLQQQLDVLSHKYQATQLTNRQVYADRQTIADKLQNATQTLASIRNDITIINGQKIDYAALISLITGALPDGADFVTMELQANTITVSGSAPDALVVADMAGGFGKSPYFSGGRVVQLAPAPNGGFTFQLAITNTTAREPELRLKTDSVLIGGNQSAGQSSN